METKYLIIGNSAGGIGAAETIRTMDKAGSITIVSDEPYPAYSRPLISEYLVTRCPLERILFRPADFYAQNNIHTVLRRKAVQLDTKARTVSLDDGGQIGWERLLLATGGLPIVPRIEGTEQKKIFTFTTLDDARAIDQFLQRGTAAVVIGGGLIGVSVTEALVKRGIKVTIVEMKERILNTILDEAATVLEEEALRHAGVRVIANHTVTGVNGTGAISSVTLNDDSEIPCNLVIVAIGVRPRIELASGAGLKIRRGIVVDRRMATSCPGVYACGDAAEAYDFVSGENMLTPVWPNAYLGGRVAGLNMAGIPTEYQGGTSMNSLKYFGVDIVSAGLVNPSDGGYEVLCRKYDHTYRKVVVKEGVLAGMIFAGKIEKSGIVFSLMKDRVNVSDFKQALIADDFGLASLPEEIWRMRLGMPPAQSDPAMSNPIAEAAGE